MSARSRNRGIAVVEFALILPIMVVLLLMVVEFGRAILTRQVLINVTREGANLAARGTALPDTIQAVQASADPLHLQDNGYVIVTQVFRDGANRLSIVQQHALGARPKASKVGTGTGNPAVLPLTAVAVPPLGQSVFVAEVFYRLDTITPLGQLVDVGLGDSFYDVAFF